MLPPLEQRLSEIVRLGDMAAMYMICDAKILKIGGGSRVGIPVHRDQRFRSIVTGHSGPS